MSSCSNCGCSNQSCGCKDGPFTTNNCNCSPSANCPVPQTCVEMVDSACVYLNNYSIVDTGFPENASMAQIVQMISLFFTNPSCVNPMSACQSVPYVYPYQITRTSISVAWISSATATSYQVEYKLTSDLSWTLVTAQSPLGPNTATIASLLSDSSYVIRINTFCAAGNCYSVTLRINTKP